MCGGRGEAEECIYGALFVTGSCTARLDSSNLLEPAPLWQNALFEQNPILANPLMQQKPDQMLPTQNNAAGKSEVRV